MYSYEKRKKNAKACVRIAQPKIKKNMIKKVKRKE
jgi:hypothetical protein